MMLPAEMTDAELLAEWNGGQDSETGELSAREKAILAEIERRNLDH